SRRGLAGLGFLALSERGGQGVRGGLRREAVRRRRGGESPETIAAALGRTSRWVRKWVARRRWLSLSPPDRAVRMSELASGRSAMSSRLGERLLFVGGPPRSGTTLVQKVLSAHPDVAGAGEFDFVPRIVDLRNELRASVRSGRIAEHTSAGAGRPLRLPADRYPSAAARSRHRSLGFERGSRRDVVAALVACCHGPHCPRPRPSAVVTILAALSPPRAAERSIPR